jgi:hypothetical protein
MARRPTRPSPANPKRATARATRSSTRPQVVGALLCEKVLQEAEGVLSAIRIVDQVIANVGDDPTVSVQIQLTALFMLKGGEAKGAFSFLPVLKGPSGKVATPQDARTPFKATFETPESGANFIVGLNLTVKAEGLYWFELMVGDDPVPLVRVPLRLVRAPSPSPPG